MADDTFDPEPPEVLPFLAERLRAAGATSPGAILREAIAYSFGSNFASSALALELYAFGDRYGLESALALLGAAEEEVREKGG